MTVVHIRGMQVTIIFSSKYLMLDGSTARPLHFFVSSACRVVAIVVHLLVDLIKRRVRATGCGGGKGEAFSKLA